MMQFLLLALLLCYNTDGKVADEGLDAETKEINKIFSSLFSVYDKELVHKYREKTLADVIGSTDETVKIFTSYVEDGTTRKGRTFNIYDDNMREASLALFKIIKSVEKSHIKYVLYWAKANINDGILEYAFRLAQLHSNRIDDYSFPAPFDLRPNFFINSETIKKATMIALLNGQINRDDSEINEYTKIGNVISINSNNSGWNLLGNGCEEETAYFREDLGLNTYYYAFNLLHPFWMENDDLEKIDPRFAEYYFYVHKQLLARYNLERLVLDQYGHKETNCIFADYNPYLEYQNGLPFPTRKSMKPDPEDWRASVFVKKSITLQSYMDRGYVHLVNSTDFSSRLELTPENHISILTKMIRSFFEKPRTAKISRAIFGANGFPEDRYNPAPSVMHHTETSLRDQAYWDLMEKLTGFIKTYQHRMPHKNLSYMTLSDFKLVSVDVPQITTYFEYYQSDITKSIPTTSYKNKLIFTARQKRLNHRDFNITINIESKSAKAAVVRLFLKPLDAEVYADNMAFFELDSYVVNLKEGNNTSIWSPKTSSRYASDDELNIENIMDLHLESPDTSKYQLFKFPKRLAIPRGFKFGLDLGLFVSVSEYYRDNYENEKYSTRMNVLREMRPFGFPFHIPIKFDQWETNNYKLINITIVHEDM